MSQPFTMKRTKSPRLLGEVVLFQTPINTWITSFIVLIVVVSLIYLLNGEYAKKSKVNGVIISSMGIARVKAKAGGTIEKQFFKAGDKIKKGDVLYLISTKRRNLQNQDHDASILAELRRSKEILQSKLVNFQELNKLRLESLNKDLAGKKIELKSLIRQNQLLTDNARISQEMLTGLNQLKQQNLVSEQTYNQSYEKNLGISLRQEEMALQVSNIENQIARLNSQIKEHPIQSKIQENELQESISSLNQRIVDVLARRDYTIVSPVDGIVATNLTKLGQIVQPGQALQTILPDNSKFQAELHIPSHAIGFVKSEQVVYMRYSAFPYQHYGLQKGFIAEVSSVISHPAELQQGVVVSNPVYKAIVNLDSQTVRAAGKDVPLHVGMTLEASVTLDSRNIWQWILEPIFSLKGKL
ncbi:HlyD family efflux transporter periplasmic adaptor subunit [Aliikangiella marina]|uniref:HlyD family efflux transporter periplasmic adaptor subunit n=1 Tax=Aliikangiella marina TaxID=1712262 RepID=A0A545TJF2_9GAMM|nr:HlyD family efflux transporter periplasmic adaptor subunit [Aliikangiella marina]TQV77364.1 HlyD family efflux transporter periplasmic adaptor subunit [Aliikangiella marina]